MGRALTRFVAGLVYYSRLVVPMALGLAMGRVTGWEKGFVIVGMGIFLADNVLTTMAKMRRRAPVRQSESSGGFLEINGQTVTLTGEDAERFQEFMQSLAAKAAKQQQDGPLQ